MRCELAHQLNVTVADIKQEGPQVYLIPVPAIHSECVSEGDRATCTARGVRDALLKQQQDKLDSGYSHSLGN